MKYSSLIFLLLLPGIIYASDTSSLSQSAGKISNNNSIDLSRKLASSNIFQTGQIKPRGDTLNAESTFQYRRGNHDELVDFEIFDAWVDLTGDIDYDGYYHRIKITFDADVNSTVETVYAKLYLSFEGGPWKQYTETELFEIYFNSQDDTYETVTELIEGYHPGRYDVLIELHSLFHPGIVASQILTQHDNGYSITLEDLTYDDDYRQDNYFVSDYYIGAGSFSWAGMIILSLLLLIKFRYFPSNNKPVQHQQKKSN